jgi:hypothetical protein
MSTEGTARTAGTAPTDRTGPTARYLELVATRPRELKRIMARGDTPDVAQLVGREFRGTNLPSTSKLLGIRRFIKGFQDDGFRDDGPAVTGYNSSVDGSDLRTPWVPRPQKDGRVRFAPFTVALVDPEAVDNRFLRALLLDYGAVPSPEPGIAGRIRDYLVRVEPGDDTLLLGQAYLAFGSRRVAVGWFALEPLT